MNTDLSKNSRDSKVRAVLAAAEKPLGPTDIARLIGESWCGGAKGELPSSAVIVPVLRRIGAIAEKGKYTLSLPASMPA